MEQGWLASNGVWNDGTPLSGGPKPAISGLTNGVAMYCR